MEYYFINDDFKFEIRQKVINGVFPNLNIHHADILFEYLLNVIDIIAIKFNFNLLKRITYEQQFRQNKYRDAIGLLYLLLPFIDDTSGIKKQSLKSLDDLYIKKKNNEDVDINKQDPKYEFTNLQYGRCKRIKNGNKYDAEEIQFSKEHLTHNYLLLLDTIQTVANKLYVNWINIRPVSPDSHRFFSLPAYEHTSKAITTHKIKDWYPVVLDKDGKPTFNNENKLIHGLCAGEMYNIISNYLFHEIKNIKWILYDIYIDDNPYKYINMLNNFLNIESCAKNISWNILSENDKFKFTNQLTNLIELFLRDSVMGKLSLNDSRHIMTALLFFFNKYGNINEAIRNGYIYINYISNKNDDDDDDETLESKVDIQTYKTTAKSLINNSMHLYEYIRSCLFDLQFTWYGSQYLTFNKNEKTYVLNTNESADISEAQDSYDRFTIKNIYNYAKSLVSYVNNDKKYVTFQKNWKSISVEDKQKIIRRLNMNSEDYINNITSKDGIIGWFNIMGYLTRTAKLNEQIALGRNIAIHDNIQMSLAKILFGVLARAGVLSEFVPDPALTDYAFLPPSTNDRNNAIQKKLGENVIKNEVLREGWEKSIYFINNMEYGNIEVTYKSGIEIKTEKYIDAISNTNARIGNWIQTYAMDWISQIGFFHHYLNNRIIYITGGTGVGKSTQIPKLLLYALKMIDYKINGKIACTQPRISPTKDNAKIISSQMGVPIESYNKSVDDYLNTNNYYVQYKYKGKSHDNKQNGLSLKIMTDGTLEPELRNPVLKTLGRENYTTQNVYDIVIVDESHEHNKNMDLILTRMKYVTYFNNDIKLVIISATMEEDEPVYRRYYRDVNDNKMYPIHNMLQKCKLDRINIDRRIHISPPGAVTQYDIAETYLPEAKPIDIILKILRETSDGDILLFQPGEGEIVSAVETINSQTPSNIIAIPFYSKMADEKRNFVGNIDDNIRKLVIPKDIRFDIDIDDTTYKKVPEGTYKRIIIVATNIAEASITINRLRYVIDTGTQKTNIYEYKTRGSILNLTPISESSRLQRKGRVGRVAPGTVFYLYKQGNMEDNKRQFNISIEDFSDKLFEMLKERSTDKSFFDETNDPNKLKSMTIKDLKTLYKDGLGEMIRNQYFINTTFYNYDGDSSHYDYENSKLPFIYYETGLDKNTLDDRTGSFYIVHPDELCFMRNILGSIVNVIENDNCDIKQENENFISGKMNSFWDILREYLFIVDDKENDIIYKTDFGSNIMKIKQQMVTLSLQQIISFIYSRKYNCTDDMIKLLAMYTTLRSVNDIVYTKLIDDKDRPQFEDTLKLYGNPHGDSYALIKISNDIINFLTVDLALMQNKQSKSLIEIMGDKKSSTIIADLVIEKRKFIDGLNKNDYKNMNNDVLNNFIQMYNKNKLSLTSQLSSEEINILIANDTYVNNYMSKFKEKEFVNLIRNWCNKRYLNYVNVMNFFNNYSRLLNNIKKYEEQLIDIDSEIVKDKPIKFSWFDATTPQLININEVSKEDLIKIPLLHGYSYNLVRNIAIINNNYYYISVFNPFIDYIFKIGQIFYKSIDKSKSKMINNTFTKPLGSTLLFINKKENTFTGDEELNFIENIPSNIISKVLPQMVHNSNQYNITLHEEYVRKFLLKLTVNKQGTSIINNIISKYIKTIEQIKYDLFNNYDNFAFEKLIVITNVSTNNEDKNDDQNNIRKIMSNKSYNIRPQFGGSFNKKTTKINNINNSYVYDLTKILNNI